MATNVNVSHPIHRAMKLLYGGVAPGASDEVRTHAGEQLLIAAGLADAEFEMVSAAMGIENAIILGEDQDDITEVQEAIMAGIIVGFVAAHLATLEPEA